MRINVGGDVYTDSFGRSWLADTYFNTGVIDEESGLAIAGTPDPELYRSQRWDLDDLPGMVYTLPLPQGLYHVVLHFSDNCVCTVTPGTRVFSALVQGQAVPALQNLDIINTAGWRTALKIVVPSVTVSSSGVLSISFIHNIDNPTLAALEVYLPLGATLPPTTTTTFGTGVALHRINCGGAAFVDSRGLAWTADSHNNGVGNVYVASANVLGAAAADQPMYTSERFGDLTPPYLVYTLPVPTSVTKVTVRLYFAETFALNAFVGFRLFNVRLQGTIVLLNYDIFADVGFNTATVKQFTATVVGGAVTISFEGPSSGAPFDGAKINGIEVMAS